MTTSNLPAPGFVQQHLRTSRPRLIATSIDFDRLRQQVRTDDQVGGWYRSVKASADKVLGEPAVRYEIADGVRLLPVSRKAVERIYLLAMCYRLEADRRYRERAWRELEAAADFPDWNPKHFLDTAEMTHALAIGYDWFYDDWTPEQRQRLRQAIVEKGLLPARACYRGEAAYGWWTGSRHNWNQVCNGGIGLGALAVAEEEPELAEEILTAVIRLLPAAIREYAPDGAWAEGPSYWHYATRYTVAILAGLESALGTDFGLGAIPGFGEAGFQPIYMTGPTGRTFNYADGSDRMIRAPEMFWLARRFGRAEFAAYQRTRMQPTPLDLLWYAALPAKPLPLDRYCRGAEVVTFRSGWEDPNALFVAFKAGDNKANHSHLDLGTFVLDALGQRWALDLGADNYNLPGYWEITGRRWMYYRLRAEGHNTLVVNPGNGPDQNPRAAATIVRYESKPDRALAVADLSAAYAGVSVRRGIRTDRVGVLVQDELRAESPAEVWWFLHSDAAIALEAEGRLATLAKDGAKFTARILAPATARFAVREAQPLPGAPRSVGQHDNAGIRKLTIHLPAFVEGRIAVLLAPQDYRGRLGEAPVALADW